MATGRQQQVALDEMPVINVTQRAPPVAGPSHSLSVLSNSNGGGDNEEEGGGDEDGKNYQKVVPRPDDEPPVVCVLYGHSVSGKTELCGWSLMTPLKFFNISDSTRFRSMTDGRGDIVSAADELSKKVISLREVSRFIGGPSSSVKCPVFVHVVAKRTVDLVPRQNRLLIIPLLVIADKSGYCVLCSMNEGLHTVYNSVEVGDLLLISECVPQTPCRTYHRGLFSEDMFLNMEVKITFHSVRTHFIYRFNPQKPSQSLFRMPEALFVQGGGDPNSNTTSTTIKLPSTLEKEFIQCPLTTKPNPNQYYDLVGVVTYVGRIERFNNMNDVTLDTFEDGKLIPAKILRRFLLYRWIYLADLQTSGSGFPVKVYVNNATWDQQGDLVSGAILVLTHCVTVDCAITGKYTATSQYSQICVHGNIGKYYMLHPLNFRDVAKNIMTRNNYCEIVNRKDIQWMVGGTHSQGKIVNGEELKDYKNSHRIWKDLRAKPLRRRESRRLYFEGEILRVVEVEEDGVLKVWQPAGGYQREKDRKKEEYHKIENFLSYKQHENTSWFAWKRKLPEVDGGILRMQRTRDICKRVVGGWKKFLGVLGLPSEYNEGEGGWKEGEVPGMGKLERVDGPPYLMMDVVNIEEKIWYGVMWKRGREGWEEMKRRVEEAKGKQVVGVVEVYCTEVDSPLEVNLLDFVVNEKKVMSSS